MCALCAEYCLTGNILHTLLTYQRCTVIQHKVCVLMFINCDLLCSRVQTCFGRMWGIWVAAPCSASVMSLNFKGIDWFAFFDDALNTRWSNVMVYCKFYNCQVCPRPQMQYACSSFRSCWKLKGLHCTTLSFCSHSEGTSPNVAVNTRYLHCLLFTFPAINFLIIERGFLVMKKVLECIQEWNCWRYSPITGVNLA